MNLIEKLNEGAIAMMEAKWALDALFPAGEPAQPLQTEVLTKAPTQAPSQKLEDLRFINPGEFYTACLRYCKLLKSKVDPEIKAYDLRDPEKRRLAWLLILKLYPPMVGK